MRQLHKLYITDEWLKHHGLWLRIIVQNRHQHQFCTYQDVACVTVTHGRPIFYRKLNKHHYYTFVISLEQFSYRILWVQVFQKQQKISHEFYEQVSSQEDIEYDFEGYIKLTNRANNGLYLVEHIRFTDLEKMAGEQVIGDFNKFFEM